jgi:hypothetical protein
MENADNDNNCSRVTFFEHIPSAPKRERILARLGHRAATTVLSDEQTIFLNRGIEEALLLCHVKGAFRRERIAECSERFVRLESGTVFESAALAQLMSTSGEMVLMAATAGTAIMEKIADEVSRGDAAFGLILDATASHAADAGLDWMVGFLNGTLQRAGKRLTQRRFSPGYGDLSLSHQKLIFDLLCLDRLGVHLTEKYILVPEKSVLAVAGIEGIIE